MSRSYQLSYPAKRQNLYILNSFYNCGGGSFFSLLLPQKLRRPGQRWMLRQLAFSDTRLHSSPPDSGSEFASFLPVQLPNFYRFYSKNRIRIYKTVLNNCGGGSSLRAGVFLFRFAQQRKTLQLPTRAKQFARSLKNQILFLIPLQLILDCLILGCGGGSCTHDLQVMGLASCYCSTPRYWNLKFRSIFF